MALCNLVCVFLPQALLIFMLFLMLIGLGVPLLNGQPLAIVFFLGLIAFLGVLRSNLLVARSSAEAEY